MNLIALSSRRRILGGPRAHRLALVLMLTATLPLVRANADADRATPPAYADSAHVLNGCFISTTAYLAQFRTHFPAERAARLSVEPEGFHSRHTIAVVSWNGRWWGRDEYFGVFSLNCAVANEPDPSQLERRAETALIRHARNEIDAGRGEFAPEPPTTLSLMERTRLVTQAGTLLPFPSEIFWVTCHDGEEIPVLFFRPAPGQVALYDPLTGTGSAECASANSAGIVKLFVVRLGHRVDHIRPDSSPATNPRLLAATTFAGGPAR